MPVPTNRSSYCTTRYYHHRWKAVKARSEFRYLGSTATNSKNLDKAISSRMGNASRPFAKLQERLKKQTCHYSSQMQSPSCSSTVLSAIMGRDVDDRSLPSQKLHVYMMRHLRQIMGITWWDKITNDDILTKVGLPSISDILMEKRLRWLGHFQKLEPDRLSRQLLYSQLQYGTGRRGQPNLRFKVVMKRNMKHRNINSNI